MPTSDNDPAPGLHPCYRGFRTYRFASNQVERKVADWWAAFNEQGLIFNRLLDGELPSDRDYKVAATVIQWLGSPVGQEFVSKLVAIPGFLAKPAPESGVTFSAEQVQMMRQLLGNTQLKVTLKGANLERFRKAKPLGGVRLSQWPTEKMHPFMFKVRQLLVNSEDMVRGELPDVAQAGAGLSVRFSDPGMNDKTVPVPAGAGGLTKILRAEEKARNYTTAQLVAGGVTIATFYRPLGGDSFQTKLPEDFER